MKMLATVILYLLLPFFSLASNNSVHIPETPAVDDACTKLEVGDGVGPAIEPENQILSLTFIRSQHESKSDSSTIYTDHFTLDISHGRR